MNSYWDITEIIHLVSSLFKIQWLCIKPVHYQIDFSPFVDIPRCVIWFTFPFSVSHVLFQVSVATAIMQFFLSFQWPLPQTPPASLIPFHAEGVKMAPQDDRTELQIPHLYIVVMIPHLLVVGAINSSSFGISSLILLNALRLSWWMRLAPMPLEPL